MRIILFFILLSSKLLAGDVYVEYQMTGVGGKSHLSKLYIKDGNRRTETTMGTPEHEMTSVSLQLTSNPSITYVLNSLNKSYTEVKKGAGSSQKNLTIEVLGDEKVGEYNCKHVRMTSDGKSWEVWSTKDISSFDYYLDNDNDSANTQLKSLMESKGAGGVPVKIQFLKPGTSTPTLTITLVKYEQKTLDTSLFQLPTDYTKSAVQFDPEKMKSMTPEEKKEMIQKMIEQNKTKVE